VVLNGWYGMGVGIGMVLLDKYGRSWPVRYYWSCVLVL